MFSHALQGFIVERMRRDGGDGCVGDGVRSERDLRLQIALAIAGEQVLYNWIERKYTRMKPGGFAAGQ